MKGKTDETTHYPSGERRKWLHAGSSPASVSKTEYDDYDEEDGGNSQKARIIKAHNRNKAIRELGI